MWELGIGLTDIAKFAYGMDHQLPRHSLGPKAAAALCARILKIAPGHLAFTSLTAGRAVLGKKAVPGEQAENSAARGCGFCLRRLRWPTIIGISRPGERWRKR